MKRDIVGSIEAAYQVQQDEDLWLRNLAQSVRPLIGSHVGVGAMVYDARNPNAFDVRRFLAVDLPTGFDNSRFIQFVTNLPGPYVDNTYRIGTCMTLTETPPWPEQKPLLDFLSLWGTRDVLGINGFDSSGIGTFLGFFLPKARRLSPRPRANLSRLSIHITAAYRLRCHLALSARPTDVVAGSEAVLEANGKLAHAEGPATANSARAALQRGVRALDRARGRLRHEDPEAAVAEWKGLIAARWTLLDHFDTDGRRYLVARKNDPVAPSVDRLTERERQLVALACLGHSSKLIAYELGISVSTTDVLIGRAMHKLGFKSRKAMINALIRAASRS